MKKIAVLGFGGEGCLHAENILKEKGISITTDLPPKLETFEITNPYKDFVGFGLPETKPSKNQLRKCKKGIHLYSSKDECVRCGKKLNL